MARKYETVDDYFNACSANVMPLMQEMRRFIHANLPGATEDLDYGVPVFLNAHGVPVVYLLASKKEHVNFGFLRSGDLSDPDGILEGSGKPSKHIKLFPDRPVDTSQLAGFVAQCNAVRP